jgi:hypothetical protein
MPNLQGGKGFGELGQNHCACAEEFPCANEVAALAQSHDKLTAEMQYHYQGEKDRGNTRLARALVGTTRISTDIHEILTVQHPVTPKRASASC